MTNTLCDEFLKIYLKTKNGTHLAGREKEGVDEARSDRWDLDRQNERGRGNKICYYGRRVEIFERLGMLMSLPEFDIPREFWFAVTAVRTCA